MKHRTIYDPETGRILRQVTASSTQIDRQTHDGESYITGHYEEQDYWVTNGQPKDRPDFKAEAPSGPLSVGEEYTLADVPEHTKVTVNGQHMADMDDSEQLEVSFDKPGAQTVTLSLWPYKDKEVAFEVTRQD